jgi:diketogulonate reductase-like aldo/keto reductase
MVKVKKPTDDSTGLIFSVQKHFVVLIVIFSVVAIGGIYTLLQSQESKMMMTGMSSRLSAAVRRSKNGSSSSAGGAGGGGVAHAHSAKFLTNKPHLVYGTAWKKDLTAQHVNLAIKSGFRFIDTACQPRHYNEPQVGDGWKSAADELGLKRDDIWLQTKYTSVGGQDPNNIPYDPNSSLEEQVMTSLEVSLKNLHTTYLDSWVLHSPFEVFEDTMRVWRVMERAVDDGRVHSLGISNCYDLHTFQTLYQQAIHKPSVLQNRFYAETNFDTDLRKFCRARNIKYQSFWTLTANRKALALDEVKTMAQSKGLTPQTYLYAFLMSLGGDNDIGYITPLDGTTNPTHMLEDVAVMERMQGGEKIFTSAEKKHFAELLGMPEMET